MLKDSALVSPTVLPRLLSSSFLFFSGESHVITFHVFLSFTGLVAQWITRLPTEQKIPGSSPGKLENFDGKLLFLPIRGLLRFLCHNLEALVILVS